MLTLTNKPAISSVLVLLLALVAAVLIRIMDPTPNSGMWAMWSCTLTVAASLIMLLVLTRDGSRS